MQTTDRARRIVTAMRQPPLDSSPAPSLSLSRRQMLLGCAGLTLSTAACTPRLPTQTQMPLTSTSTHVPATTVPPQQSSAPLIAAAGTTATMLCRDAWGAMPALPGGRRQGITRMTLHHTGAVLGDNRNAPGRLRQHQRLHQSERGWTDIAYHVSVDRNGNIYELRAATEVGDTATDYDPTGHFLVLCEGDFDQEFVSEAQLASTALVFAWAAQTFGITSSTLAGHRDLAATACPGDDLYHHLASGDLRRRIDDLLTQGAVNLQKVCGPEAVARVAAIEAGG
jgi:hypothetical protein